MSATAVHADVRDAYESVAYAGRPNHHSHPDRLAAIASLLGLRAAGPDRARILEAGCGDGANLLPLAARYPDATFVGCDLSSLLVARARATSDALGLRNVQLVEGDLREVAPTLGTFDYVIAHGFYSWVPADVREAFIAMLGRQLNPGGLAYVSYNVLPGCFVRRIGWDVLRSSVPRGSAAERLASARREFADLAAAWSAMPGIPGHLGRDFAGASMRTDSALFHDDLATVNEAVYFTTFVQGIARHGLGFLAEAEPGTMSLAGLPPRVSELIARADAVSREQYLDFARVRRFRQSIVAPAADVTRARFTPEAVAQIHVSVATSIMQQRASGAARSVDGPMVDFLADAYPASVPGGELVAFLERRGMAPPMARTMAMRGCFSGAVDLHAAPLPVVASAGERPRVWHYARWQATTHEDWVPSLRHDPIRVDDATARAVLVACDGTRDRAVIARAAKLAGDDAIDQVENHVERFTLAGLVEA